MVLESANPIATNSPPPHGSVQRHASSALLRVIVWYFKIGGIIFAVMLVFGLIGAVLGWASPPNGLAYPVAFVVVLSTAAALFATGILLARRSKVGALLGLVLTLYPFAFALWYHTAPRVVDLAVAAVTVAGLLFVWRELDWPRPAHHQ